MIVIPDESETSMSLDNALRARGAVPATTRVLLVAVLLLSALLTVIAAVGGIGSLAAGASSGVLSVDLVATGTAPGAGTGDLVRDAPAGVVALVTAGYAAGVLGRVVLGAALAVMLLAVLRRAPFSSATAVAVTLFGAVAAIAAVLQVGLGSLGDLMVADLLTRSGAGTWPSAATFDLSPLAVGFGLMVVGLFLSHGDQLQRATRGLV